MEELSYEQKEHLRHLMRIVENAADITEDWVDPKVLGLLEICHKELEEQLLLEKIYYLEDSDGDPFIDHSDVPTLDELKDMFGDQNDT